jgi:tetratricopeptide (TPR) repeat protein
VIDCVQFAEFRRLMRDIRNPARLRTNRLATRVCSVEPSGLASTLRQAVEVSLYRLPSRQREIVRRYDLSGEPVGETCKALAVSRRQFFRDHRAALRRLATFMLQSTEGTPGVGMDGCASVEIPIRSSMPLSMIRTLVAGLRNAGAYDEAIAVLRRACLIHDRPLARIELWVDLAEIAHERGDAVTAANALERARRTIDVERAGPGPVLTARISLVDGQLASSHLERRTIYHKALALLRATAERWESVSEGGAVLVKTLHALSLSDDHRGDWVAAREAARAAASEARRFGLEETPLGLVVKANHVMRDARQFGDVDAALRPLRDGLSLALRNGWVQGAGDIVVHFVNVNLMRSRYSQALEWKAWISSVDPARFTARTRNFLAVDIAHALTMLGRPEQALMALQSGSDEGLAFAGAREYWRAEALRASGNVGEALALASRALDGAADADSGKGKARTKRLLASCHNALGHGRFAHKTLSECLELSSSYVSPYDLLLTMAVARQIGRTTKSDERRLALLLRGCADDREFGPPAALA